MHSSSWQIYCAEHACSAHAVPQLAGAPARLAQALQAMGYSAEAASAAHAATQSDDVGRNIDWLVSPPPAASAATSSPRQQSAALRSDPPSRYPDIQFASPQHAPALQPAAAIHSHPVAAPELYGSHTPGYSGGEPSTSNPLLGRQSQQPPQDAGPSSGDKRAVGMAGLIHGRKAEAEKLTAAVHSGFQDLEARCLCAGNLHVWRCSAHS